MWFRLAWQMGMSVREAQRRIDSAEFSEWCAFLRLEPDLGTRLDFLANELADRIGRVEATFGGSQIPHKPRLIDWGWEEADDENSAIDMLERAARKYGKK